MKIGLFTLLLLTTFTTAGSELKPFTSDGCSAFPDGTLSDKELWLDCCIKHDIAYWQGGSAAMRKQADMDLKNCVAQAGKPMIAQMMLAGVRVGGTPYLPTQFRWAYGWPYLRGYQTLNNDEQDLVKKALEQYETTKTQQD